MIKKKSNTLKFSIPIAIVFIIWTVYEYGYIPLRDDIQEIQELKSAKLETLRKYEKTIDEIPRLEAELESLSEERKKISQFLIEGQTHSVASSALQDSIKNIISSRGGTTQGQRVEKTTDMDKFKVVSVNTNLQVNDVKMLLDILYAIQLNKPAISIKEIDIRVINFKEPRQLLLSLTTTGLTEAK